jgi:hypothetical protein
VGSCLLSIHNPPVCVRRNNRLSTVPCNKLYVMKTMLFSTFFNGTDTKAEGKSRMPQYYKFHAPEDAFLPLREISHLTGIFSCHFPIPVAEIYPPCRNFSGHIPIPHGSYRTHPSADTGIKATYVSFHSLSLSSLCMAGGLCLYYSREQEVGCNRFSNDIKSVWSSI